jgi:SAM-dependent MidA family methyltransferase
VHAVGSLIDVIRERGPVTVAAFMDLALYHPTFGYYARAARRSGRAGDFFTSVDVGPLFGELLAIQFAEMFELLSGGTDASSRYDLVEAGAGDGRLALDVLRGLERHAPRTLARISVSLIESSAAARAEHTTVLQPYAGHLRSSAAELPEHVTGILYANEILDAFPVHQVVMRADGLKDLRRGPRRHPDHARGAAV